MMINLPSVIKLSRNMNFNLATMTSSSHRFFFFLFLLEKKKKKSLCQQKKKKFKKTRQKEIKKTRNIVKLYLTCQETKSNFFMIIDKY